MKTDDTSKPSIERIAELQQLIADFSEIKRHINIADKGRKENDVEHSFGLALTAWFLASHLAPHLDIGKVLKYALAHDIVELHAGDTFIFDKEAVATKSMREDSALDQLYKDLPDFKGLVDAAHDYKSKADAEARFVYTVDKMVAPLMIYLGERDTYWKKHKITKDMHSAAKKETMRYSKELEGYSDMLAEFLKDNFFYNGSGDRS